MDGAEPDEVIVVEMLRLRTGHLAFLLGLTPGTS
jgi:hypothetical protein